MFGDPWITRLIKMAHYFVSKLLKCISRMILRMIIFNLRKISFLLNNIVSPYPIHSPANGKKRTFFVVREISLSYCSCFSKLRQTNMHCTAQQTVLLNVLQLHFLMFSSLLLLTSYTFKTLAKKIQVVFSYVLVVFSSS